MQSFDVKYVKPRLLEVYLSAWRAHRARVCLCAMCVAAHLTFPSFLFFSHSASQAVGAGGNCGGRELVRAVSLGDVNMAMLSWHRT